MEKSDTAHPLADAVKTYVNRIDSALMGLGTHLPAASQRLFLEHERKRLVVEGDNLIDQMKELESQVARLRDILQTIGLKV